MAKLSRTYIELVKNPDEVLNGGEAEIEKVWTPAFISWGTVRQAMQTLMEYENEAKSEFEVIDKMEEFVANDVFGGKITVDDLRNRLHAPNAIQALKNIVEFVAYGDPEQEANETRAFLEKKN